VNDGMLARACRANGVRYIVLAHPIPGLASSAKIVGLDDRAFVRGHDMTKLGRATWWWRAWSDQPQRHFRRVAPLVWELTDVP